MTNKDKNKYEACSMTALAQFAGVTLETFQNNLERRHMHAMVDLGWSPWKRKLLPPVVRYLREEFITKTPFHDDLD